MFFMDLTRKISISGKQSIIVTYKAMHKYLDGGVHAGAIDFPGVVTAGRTPKKARRLPESALVDMAETAFSPAMLNPGTCPCREEGE